jgi:dolichyl-phosphate beta-glucosyltransferase
LQNANDSTPEAAAARPFLTVVIPAYNEERRLGSTLDTVVVHLTARPFTWEILVVDDGSTDGTIAVAQARRAAGAPVRVVSYRPNCGKGHAVRVGMLAAAGELALLCDADLSTPIEELTHLLARIEAGADVAIGSRRAPGHEVRVPQPLYRVFLGRIHSWLCHQFLVPTIQDFTCGFKLFKREVVQRLFGKCRQDRWTYDPEIIYLVYAAGYRIDEAPVVWVNDAATRVRLAFDVLDSLRGLVAIFCNHRLGLFLGSSASECGVVPVEIPPPPPPR